MATSGQSTIRGIDIDRLAKGFADKSFVMKRYVTVSKTSARELRWYQKGTSYDPLLDSTDTTGITASQILNTSFRSLPVVVEQAWTRNTSYIKKFFVESPTISVEDIKDCDIDILATNVRDLVKAVANQVDAHIYNIITEGQSVSNITTHATTGTGWDDTTNGNPVLDILTARQKIAAYNYDLSAGVVLVMNSTDHKNLVNYLITVKGSSIPNFSSEKVKAGVVMELLGCQIVVTETAVSDSCVLFIPSRAATWKSFMPMSTAIIDDPGIGKKIRVWEEGICILTDPKAVCLITDTLT